ncbi:MAG: hypothetical protein JWM96_45 [Alphaproteobacteria bacterium]|nr:hypothetical protein [Alphaproteobacteria bacterium]
MTENYFVKHAQTETEWAQVKTLLAELLAFEIALRPQRKETAAIIDGAFSLRAREYRPASGRLYHCS